MAKSERILALDIGASNLKLGEFQTLKSGGVQLSRYVVGSLGMELENEDERSRYIVTTLREMMQENQIAPGPILISVSGQSVFSRFVKLPVVTADKVQQMVLYEAQQNVPFPIQEVVWDYQLIAGVEGEIDVMLAAIKGDIIDDLTDCVSFAGLKADLVDVAPMALYNTVRYNYHDLSGCTLLVDIGARATNLIFIEGNRVFSRSIPVAGNEITKQIMREFDLSFSDAEDLKMAHAFVAFGGAYEAPSSEVADKVSKSVRAVMTRMHGEINRSINFYRSQQAGTSPNLVLLTGGTSIIGYTDVFFKEKLKVEVEYLNPFQNVPVAAHISAEEIGQSAHMMGEVVGLALRRVLTCPIELDLMPPKVIAEKKFKKKQPFLVMGMVGLVLAVVVWCGYFLKMTDLKEERLNNVKRKVAELQRKESIIKTPEVELTRTKTKIGMLSELLDERPRWLKVLDVIHGVLPKGMWLYSVQPISGVKEEAPVAAPAPRGGGRGSRNAPPPPPKPSPEILEIEIAGYGYRDLIDSPVPIEELLKNLEKSEEFTEGSEITWQPAPGPIEQVVVREFKIKLQLAKPIKI